MRLAIVGDVGGQYLELTRALTRLGVDVEAALVPEDLVVCQVGDLVHRGPASPAVVFLVDRLLRRNPGRWVQLAGNHEAQYLFPPRFEWPEVLDPAAALVLRSWWDEGLMLLAAAFETEGVVVRQRGGVRAPVGSGPLLVTHAGLSHGCWRRLGSPASAVETADAVNALRMDPSSVVWRAGRMLGSPDLSAGVVWAEDLEEVLRPWVAEGTLPFSQAHGHSSAVWWDSGTVSPRFARLSRLAHVSTHVDRERRILRTVVGDRVVWSVDPGHGVLPARSWEPLVLDLV